MIGFYNYTVILTYCGLLSSLLGMFYAFSGNIMGAAICLIVAGGCDMFDGKIARTKKDRTADEKRFGIQIDSLCDVVCFGVLPTVIGFSVGATRWWQLMIAGLFTLCGLIRLGYYNVTEETRQQTTDKKREAYTGLPITASALLMPALLAFSKPLGPALPYAYTALQLVVGLCYITPLSVKKPGKIGMLIMLILGWVVIFSYIL